MSTLNIDQGIHQGKNKVVNNSTKIKKGVLIQMGSRLCKLHFVRDYNAINELSGLPFASDY